MVINNILRLIEKTSSRKEKEDLLKLHDSILLRKVLFYTYEPYKQYYVCNLPKFHMEECRLSNQEELWNGFFNILDRLDRREITGSNAINLLVSYISRAGNTSEWMIRVLERHLNIGITEKTINKIYPGLISIFDVQLAQIFEKSRIKDQGLIGIEPKLDGLRCIAITKGGNTNLYSRNGKVITTNYENTIVRDINELVSNGKIPDNIIFDGELMGKDFTATVSQFRRKTGADVSSHFYHIFDYMTYDEWQKQETSLTSQSMRNILEDFCLDSVSKFLTIVPRDIVLPEQIEKQHDHYVSLGYEGAMIKILDSKYKFGRGFNVMKLKNFHDIDLEVVGFEEGTGKYKNSLGSVIVKYNNVRINIGSGFSDEQRLQIWNNRGKYRNKIVEVRYQELTPDGSLRFPTFRKWRIDKK